jgi:hypothetical protein
VADVSSKFLKEEFFYFTEWIIFNAACKAAFHDYTGKFE